MSLKDCPHYYNGTIFPNLLKKYWFWFCDPEDVEKAAMVNFFSYNKVDKPGFKVKAGLTTVIDLTQDLDSIWANMRQKFICKQISRGERNGIFIERNNNFRDFKKVYKMFREKKKLAKDKFFVFEKNGLLFNAYYPKSIIASGLFISDGKNIRAWVLASLRHIKDNRMREIIGQANRMIIWEAIKFAKETGHKIFDLGGIAPDSSDRAQQQLAEFKEGFGGRRIECYYYSKVYSKIIKYWMRLRGFSNI